MILIKVFLNSKLDLIQIVEFVKQMFRIQKGGKVLLWDQLKCRMEACYSELILNSKDSKGCCSANTIHIVAKN